MLDRGVVRSEDVRRNAADGSASAVLASLPAGVAGGGDVREGSAVRRLKLSAGEIRCRARESQLRRLLHRDHLRVVQRERHGCARARDAMAARGVGRERRDARRDVERDRRRLRARRGRAVAERYRGRRGFRRRCGERRRGGRKHDKRAQNRKEPDHTLSFSRSGASNSSRASACPSVAPTNAGSAGGATPNRSPSARPNGVRMYQLMKRCPFR